MTSAPDQDQQWLVGCLTATLDTSHEVRSFAETSLQQAALQPGYGAALAKVTINKELPFGLRQLAAVVLKQFIKEHWQEDDENFRQPAVSTSEKVVIRQLLPPSLDDSHGKIRTAIGMAIACIAQYDWPENWPELLPFLLKLISEQSKLDGVRGALRCLALLSDDLDDTMVPKLVPALFPYLHTIISSPNLYEKSMRAKALSIIHSFFTILGTMSGNYKTESVAMMTPMVNALTEQFSIILQPPVQSGDPDDWSIRMEVLKCLLQIVQNFPSFGNAQISVIVAPLWQTFVSSLKVYELSSIGGSDDPHSDSFDSDGGEKSLDTLVVQIFEFLLTMVGNPRMAEVMRSSIKELAYYIIAFLQMTEEQVHTWSLDANQYVADEDEFTYSCRVSGSLLLEEIVSAYDGEGIDSVIEAAQRRFTESRHAKAAGSTTWWKMHEAALFALFSISETLLEAPESGLTKSLGNILEQMVTEEMGTGVHDYPFLHARAFSTVSKFSTQISRRVSDQFLFAAIQAIANDCPPPVKVGACQVLSQLLQETNPEMLVPNLVGLYSSLTDLLKKASDETLHLVLETLQAAIKAGHELSTSIEPMLSPVILNVWVEHVSDPFISIDAVEVLEAIKDAPGCMRPLVSRILPAIGSILEKPLLQPDGLVAGSLDLLTMILKNAPIDVVKAVFDVCFNSVIQVILISDDHGEMQNATECLAAFLSGGRQELLSWGSEADFTMKSLLDAASRLLDPDLESSGSLFVGSFILQLILHLPSQMAPHMRDLVTAIVRRMESCAITALKSSLIVIFARLVHLSSPGVDQFINLLLTVPAKGHENALSYVLSEWTKLQGEIQGAYQIKVTTSALALLLATRHAELAKINVQGHLIKSNTGITTRSKAKLAPDQWTMMSLPTKIFSLLSDFLVEIQEQVLDDDEEEDSDWEEASENDAGVGASEEILYSSTLQSGSGRNLRKEHLDAMAKVFDDSDDESFEDELMKADPLNEMKLQVFLKDFFVSLAKTDRSLFDYLCQGLTQAQRSTVKKFVNQ